MTDSNPYRGLACTVECRRIRRNRYRTLAVWIGAGLVVAAIVLLATWARGETTQTLTRVERSISAIEALSFAQAYKPEEEEPDKAVEELAGRVRALENRPVVVPVIVEKEKEEAN